MPQYFIPAENIRNGEFSAGPEESLHIARVARARAGDGIDIFDGKGNRYRAVIKSSSREAVSGTVTDRLPSPEYKTRITLCFSAVARAALESVLEHCTEAGVEIFQPVISARTQFDLLGGWERRLARFNQILMSAAKQCGRGRLPELRRPEKFADLLISGGPAVVASAEGKSPDETAGGLAGKMDVRLFVGPEGGFTKEELDLARSRGAAFMNLGLYTLRAESACLAASSALLTRLG